MGSSPARNRTRICSNGSAGGCAVPGRSPGTDTRGSSPVGVFSRRPLLTRSVPSARSMPRSMAEASSAGLQGLRR